ncbi:MAG: branched-chain amino acid ABC transporter ATP-binding protein/permease [Deferrisomatales bacterium]
MFPKRVYKILGLVGLYVFLCALPFGLKFYQQDFVLFLLINILVVTSYRLMTLTGEWSLIHIVFMGAGAYTSALLAKMAGLSFWITMPVAGAVTGLLALILSFPLFRMTEFYFLIGSFAAGEAIRLSWSYFTEPFGGPKGIKLIPSPALALPGLGVVEIWEPIPYYFLTLVIVSVCLWVLYRLEHSRIGLTLHAVHWKDALAESVGVNTWNYRALAFVTASFFVGIAGALFAHYLGTINPHQFGVSIMVYVLVWVIVGGTKTFEGPIVGAVVLSVANEWFRGAEELRPLIYGCILIGCTMFLPDGLESIPSRLRRALGRGGESPEEGPSGLPAAQALAADGPGGSVEPFRAAAQGNSAGNRSRPPAPAPLLEVREVTKWFGGLAALSEVSFSVEEGEIRGLIGPNGAGKSTMFKIVAGFYRPTAGHVVYRGENVVGQRPSHIAARGLVRTFQETTLFHEMTVFDNVLVGCHLHARSSLLSALLRTDRERQARARAKAAEVLAFMGLTERRDQLAANLPLGSQRALAIAVALAAEPKLLLLDEPFAGMNPEETAHNMELVAKVRDSGVTIVLVEHDMRAVMGLCDRLTVLNFGQLLAEGSPEEIRSNDEVIRAYLGSA